MNIKHFKLLRLLFFDKYSGVMIESFSRERKQKRLIAYNLCSC